MHAEERYFIPSSPRHVTSFIIAHLDGGDECFSAAEMVLADEVDADKEKAQRITRELLIRGIMHQIQGRLFGA